MTLRIAAIGLAGVVALAGPAVAWAQADPAGPAIDAIARQAEMETQLRSATIRLSRDPQNVNALIDAGTAALALDNAAEAVGYFTRARNIVPGDVRAARGLASAFARLNQPLRAIELFRTEGASLLVDAFTGDQGLAYDLVGDNLAAQQEYRRSLQAQDDPLIRSRLAVSLAISGDRDAARSTLAPLASRGDPAATRARAFSMAIMGDAVESVAIAEAAMPRQLAARIAPYLQYMPRLTKAQQAAAANLGIFPRTAQIGTDAPQIAQYRPDSAIARNADRRLTPSGPAFGEAELAAVEPVAVATGESSLPAVAAQAETVSPPAVAEIPAAEVAVAIPEAGLEAATSQAVERADTARAPEAIGPGFDLARVAGSTGPGVTSTVAAAEPQVPDNASVADAFADLAVVPATSTQARPGRVDITRIEPPREKAPAEPEPVTDPSRIWVQVATGRERDRLAFDWRRFGRQAPEVLGKVSGHTAVWGESHRLLAGPYADARAARTALNALAEAGIEGFIYTSPEGETVDPIR